MVTKAAGLMIFRRLNNEIEYLLLQTSYGKNHWTPPKGHVDPGEDEYTTALRETREEAGYDESDLNIYKEHSYILHYNVKGKPKEVTYWLAKLLNPNQEPKLSHEHIHMKWLLKDEAINHYGTANFTEMANHFHAIILKLEIV